MHVDHRVGLSRMAGWAGWCTTPTSSTPKGILSSWRTALALVRSPCACRAGRKSPPSTGTGAIATSPAPRCACGAEQNTAVSPGRGVEGGFDTPPPENEPSAGQGLLVAQEVGFARPIGRARKHCHCPVPLEPGSQGRGPTGGSRRSNVEDLRFSAARDRSTIDLGPVAGTRRWASPRNVRAPRGGGCPPRGELLQEKNGDPGRRHEGVLERGMLVDRLVDAEGPLVQEGVRLEEAEEHLDVRGGGEGPP